MTIAEARAGRWQEAAERVLTGRPLDRGDALDVLRAGDEELLDVLAAAYRVRHRWFGNRVHLNVLVNARCGGCSEDCGYCSQSSAAPRRSSPTASSAPKTCWPGAAGAAAAGEDLLHRDLGPAADGRRLRAAAGRRRADQGGGRVEDMSFARASHGGAGRPGPRRGRGPRQPQPQLQPPLLSADLLDARVRRPPGDVAGGRRRGDGNLFRRHRRHGRGGRDVVDLAMELAALEAEAVPINFFQPIPGTPLGETNGEFETVSSFPSPRPSPGGRGGPRSGATAGLPSSDSAQAVAHGDSALLDEPAVAPTGEPNALPSFPSPRPSPGGRGGPIAVCLVG